MRGVVVACELLPGMDDRPIGVLVVNTPAGSYTAVLFSHLLHSPAAHLRPGEAITLEGVIRGGHITVRRLG